MKLVIFIHQDAVRQIAPLTGAIDRRCQGVRIQMHHTVSTLGYRLRQYTDYYEKEVFILMADTASRLSEFLGLREALEGRQLLFILPDRDLATLRLAQTFSPRFFTSLNTSYEDLCAVINKMNYQKAI